jgi:hypothetical protein
MSYPTTTGHRRSQNSGLSHDDPMDLIGLHRRIPQTDFVGAARHKYTAQRLVAILDAILESLHNIIVHEGGIPDRSRPRRYPTNGRPRRRDPPVRTDAAAPLQYLSGSTTAHNP